MVQARPFEIDGVVVPGHYVIIADDVVLLQADYNIVAMKRDGKMYADNVYGWEYADSLLGFMGRHIFYGGRYEWVDLNNGDLIH